MKFIASRFRQMAGPPYALAIGKFWGKDPKQPCRVMRKYSTFVLMSHFIPAISESATLPASSRSASSNGEYTELLEVAGRRAFVPALAGNIVAEAAR